MRAGASVFDYPANKARPCALYGIIFMLLHLLFGGAKFRIKW